MSGMVRLEYCKPCLDAAAHGDMPTIPSHITPAKANAAALVRGVRRAALHAACYAYAYAVQDAAC